jgi:rhodanese-related sulfurtransferase
MTVSKRNAVIILVIVALLSVIAAMYTANRIRDREDYGDVSVQEARQLIEKKKKLTIVDVRTISEYNEGHIENAINLPVQELSDRLDELNKNDELLIYCRTGNRSSTAVDILSNAGFNKIFHMHKGISIWIQQGYPIVQ